jgi:ribonuclease P protein component
MASRLGRKKSLCHASEFRRVREHGVSCVGRWIILGVLKHPGGVTHRVAAESPENGNSGGAPHPEFKAARFGIIASRKVGGAVTRNLFRRRIRHIHQRHQLSIQGAPWLVVVARYCAGRASFEELDKEWRKLATKAGLLTL